MKYSFSAAEIQSWRAFHAYLPKIALHHRYFSKNFTTIAEQWYWKMHLDGCFWGRIHFGNIPAWLLPKESCKNIFILEITHILHFLLWRYVKEERIFMIFLRESFGEKCKHTELALSFVQKQYFSLKKNRFPLHFSQIGTLWTRKKLLLKFSIFEGTLRP